MKIKTIIDASAALQKLSATDLPLKTAYKISKLLPAIEKEVAFFNKKRTAIIEKYVDSTTRTFTPENEQKAVFEISELLDLETDVKIEPVEIPDTEDIKLSANDISVLTGFVTFKE